MDLSTLMTLGFLGLASGGFGSAGSIPIGAGTGAPVYGNVNTPVVRLLPNEPQAAGAPAGIIIPIFKESDFPFVTIVKDDGTDKAGGWQEAKVDLEFIKVRDIPPSLAKWKCPITIGIPIRHRTRGYISPSLAAQMSAFVTNAVTLTMDFDLPRGIFCSRFKAGVETAFPIAFPNLGAKVGL